MLTEYPARTEVLEQDGNQKSQSNQTTESAGVSNTRLNLKNSTILIPGESWKEALTLGDGQEGMIADIDWARLEGTANADQWRQLVMLIFPGRNENFWVNKDTNIKNYPSDPGYQCCAVGEWGTKLSWRKNEETYHWALTLPGTALKAMGTLGWAKTLVALIADFPDVRPTRLDFYLEDYAGRLRPEDITDALLKHNYSGFRKKALHLSDSDGDGLDGFTATLGSRESDSYWRIYHTRHKHKYDAIRLERELKGDKVQAAWFMLKTLLLRNQWTLRCFDHGNRQQAEWDIAGLIGGLAVEGLEFLDCSQKYGNGSLENCSRLDWWESFKRECSAVELKCPQKVRTLATTYKWLDRQVKKTLRKLSDGLGTPRFLDLIQNLINGVTNLDPRDKMQVAILRERGMEALTEKTIEDTTEIAEYQRWQNDWMQYLAGYGRPVHQWDSRWSVGI
jgi:DNA relaxase NicK